jgi:hypothetical protein
MQFYILSHGKRINICEDTELYNMRLRSFLYEIPMKAGDRHGKTQGNSKLRLSL